MPTKDQILVATLAILVVRSRIELIRKRKLINSQEAALVAAAEAIVTSANQINYLTSVLDENDVPATEFDMIVLNSIL